MARKTIASLEYTIEQCRNIIDFQLNDIAKLNEELECTRKNIGVVSDVEFNGVLSELNSLKVQYKVLKQLYEWEKKKNNLSTIN